MERVTAKQVAESLGLRSWVAQNVLGPHGGDDYSPSIREAVLKRAEEMGFTPRPRWPQRVTDALRSKRI